MLIFWTPTDTRKQVLDDVVILSEREPVRSRLLYAPFLNACLNSPA